MDNCTTKRCTKCGNEKSISSFYERKKGSGKYGSKCKTCISYQHGYTPLPPKPVPQEGYKYCSLCKQQFPATTTYFTYTNKSKGKFSSQCKSCERIYRDNHKEEIIKRVTEWSKNNPEKVKKNKKKWVDKNPTYFKSYYEKNSIRLNLLMADWQKNNPLKVRARYYRRKTRINNSGENFTADDVTLQLKSQHNKCWHCGKTLDDKYHIDHLIPLARGGSNGARNIVISCSSCNLSKGAKLPQEWNGKLF